MLLEYTPGVNDQTGDRLEKLNITHSTLARLHLWHGLVPSSEPTHFIFVQPSDQVAFAKEECVHLGRATDGTCPGAADNRRLPVETPVGKTSGGAEWDDILCGDLWGRALGLGGVHVRIIPGGRGTGRGGCGRGRRREGEEAKRGE